MAMLIKINTHPAGSEKSRTHVIQLLRPLVLLALLISSSPTWAVIYKVGPGQAHEELTTVPWLDLKPGDQVHIHWREQPYRTKIGIMARGTPSQRIVIRGIAGPGGQRPEISGDGAVTAISNRGFFNEQWDEFLGVVVIKRGSSQPWGFKPGYITIDGLKITGGHPNYGYTDQNGDSARYRGGSGGIWAILVENFVVRNCEITDNGNGLFVLSKDEEATVSRDVLVQNNHIHTNGIAGSYLEHNIYTQVAAITFEGNRIGRLRPGAQGSSLKDRSSSTVIRYNWIEPNALAIDLVDPEDSGNILVNEPGFNNSYVYGNFIYHDAIRAKRRGEFVANRMIHFGGDSGQTEIYRKRLHFFHNTVVIRSNLSDSWRMHVFKLSTESQSVHVSNNVLYRDGDSNFMLMTEFGDAWVRGRNWISAGWQPGDERYFVGDIRILQSPITGASPALADIENKNLEPTPGSAIVDTAGSLPAELSSHPIRRTYWPAYGTNARTVQGAGADIGAFEAPANSGALARVSIRDRVVDEGSGSVSVPIELSKAVSTPVAVSVYTRTITASPGRDYYGFTRRVEFAPGQTRVDVPVTILDGGDKEGDEILMMRLFGLNSTQAALGRSFATVSIYDND